MVEAGNELAAQWNAYVDAQPRSCVYHRFEFRHIIERSFGHRVLYLAALDQNRRICGILPAIQINSRIFGNYMVSVPFFNYGGALADDDGIEQTLMQHLNERGAALGVSHIEYRDTQPRPGYVQKTEKSSLILKLPSSPDTLWDDIGTKVRAQIKKAQGSGLTFKTGRHELLDDFYHVFAINMRDLGTPVYAKDFFKNILDAATLDARLAIAYLNNKPVSCAFLIAWHDTMEIPWASTLREANACNANMFLYWNVLKSATESGIGFFDFGRSSKDAGTFKFKLQWGAQPQQLYWHYWLKDQTDLPALNPNNPKYRIAIAVWQRLPVWLTRLIGPHLVKNLP
ncbi:MAG TPA: FemAB family XrtA/PEP-CTERM system-associated protein [Candidatus Kapabacteria bacterium]|nr:FemAB family XrtA/PEP-CTERM system-associated protein [Candidatus Kapabacteria bacterium]